MLFTSFYLYSPFSPLFLFAFHLRSEHILFTAIQTEHCNPIFVFLLQMFPIKGTRVCDKETKCVFYMCVLKVRTMFCLY